jgi:DNA-directed RNA polymerase specialized sigma24 family protein
VLQEQFLLAKLKARDPHAWKKVIQDLFPLAISISRTILQSHNDAEDITQQALIALSAPDAIEKAKIKNLDQLKNFFAAIVRNKSKTTSGRKPLNAEEMEKSGTSLNWRRMTPNHLSLMTGQQKKMSSPMSTIMRSSI